jgi:Na+-driven multidrug efflux pump
MTSSVSQNSQTFDRRTRQLLDEPVVPTLLRMAIPNALVMFSQMAIGLVEVFSLARLGVDVLAGVSLIFPVFSLVGAVSQGAVGAALLRRSPVPSVEEIATAPIGLRGMRWPSQQALDC